MDAAAAAALCLALLAPHRTSIDASGSLLYWEYRNRTARDEGPTLMEWGGPNHGGVPRLLVALAQLHARYGALPWSQVLQPAIDLARGGYSVSRGLAMAASGAGRAGWLVNGVRADPAYADYLETLQRNTSAELTAMWSKDANAVRFSSALANPAGGWRFFVGGVGAASAARAIVAAIETPFDVDEAERRVVAALVNEAYEEKSPAGGVATGLAVVDPVDTYIALVTGLSVPFGSLPPWSVNGTGGEGSAANARDSPAAPIDLTPAILLNENVCGTRYVLGAESTSALVQAAASLATSGGDELGPAIERARVGVLPGGVLALESAAPPSLQPLVGATVNASLPYAAVNVVQQRGDALASHADSRSGGLSSRF
ncbi:glutathione hydrolase 6-like isoform X2 [Cydia fagiglandana]